MISPVSLRSMRLDLRNPLPLALLTPDPLRELKADWTGTTLIEVTGVTSGGARSVALRELPWWLISLSSSSANSH